MSAFISVVIPTKNRKSLLLQTLESLRTQTIPPSDYEIIVAADGCSDGTCEAVRDTAALPEWKGHVLRCLELPASGASAARNRGLNEASGRYVLFLDDDIEAAPGLLRAHRDTQTAHAPQGAAVIGRLLPAPAPKSEDGREQALRKQLNRWWHTHFARLEEGPVTFMAVFTGNLSVPRAVALAAGGLDERLDYGEDVEFGFRLSQAGIPTVFARDAEGTDRNPKLAASLLRDFSRSGRGSVHMYRRAPAMYRYLPLSAYGETNLRMRVARSALLGAALFAPLRDAIDRAFEVWAASKGSRLDRQLFELARSYYFWLGVRSESSSKDEWRRWANPGAAVLMYHGVTGQSERRQRFAIRRTDLRRQLRLLSLFGYKVCPLETVVDAVVEGTPLPPRAVVLTFDDGYRDFLRAWPLFRKGKVPVTLFCISAGAGQSNSWETGIVGGSQTLLSWEELRALRNQGLDVQSHGVEHRDLRTLTTEEIRRELQTSKQEIESRLGSEPQVFAYPYGHTSPEIGRLASEAGYLAGVTARPGLNTVRTDPFTLKRIEIEGTDSLALFLLKVWAGSNPVRYFVRRHNSKANTEPGD